MAIGLRPSLSVTLQLFFEFKNGSAAQEKRGSYLNRLNQDDGIPLARFSFVLYYSYFHE